jgi:cholesterol oxidase
MALSAYPPLFGERRALACPALERIDFPARDGAMLCLHHTSGGTRGPVVITPGTAMTALSFCLDTVPVNLVEFLVARGFDVWLLDWRTSPILEAHTRPYTLDDVARCDWPAALDQVHQRTGAAQVSVLAHCLSAPTFLLSLLRGCVRAAQIKSMVASQAALHLRFTRPGAFKIAAAVDRLMPAANIAHQRPADSTGEVADRFLSISSRLLPHVPFLGLSCGNSACYRQAATFGELILHARVNDATHALMGDLVPECGLGFLRDVAVWSRQGDVLTVDDRRHLDRLRVPIRLISGAENRMFVPESTARSYALLCEANGASLYERKVYDGFGHLDCYVGEAADTVIWPDLATTLGA